MIQTRRAILTAFAAALAAAGVPALAASRPAYFTRNGYVIRGYDPVAYFLEEAPRKGSTKHKLSYGGATWLFKSAKNKALFRANPAKYEPAYGGYCAYAMSRGDFAKTEANAWSIHKGKLYLNYDRSIRATWDRDRSGYIRKADKHWPRVRST